MTWHRGGRGSRARGDDISNQEGPGRFCLRDVQERKADLQGRESEQGSPQAGIGPRGCENVLGVGRRRGADLGGSHPGVLV